MSSELRWQVFFSVWTRFHRFHVFGLAEDYRSNRSIQLGDTDFTTGKTFCHLFLLYSWSSSTQWILSSTSIIILSSAWCWISRTKPIRRIPRETFLEIDVKGGERDHIKACRRERSHQGREKVSRTKPTREKVLRGRERLPGGENTQGSQMSQMLDAWCSRGEMSHVLLREKTCSYVLICISSVHLFLWALFFCSLSSPSIPC